MKKNIYRVIETNSEAVLAKHVKPAHTIWTRLVGLLGSKELPEQTGLWLKPCGGIHTIGMNYPIDVVFLDKKKYITKLTSNIKPNRFCSAGRKTQSVLELPAGTLSRFNIKTGDQLSFKDTSYLIMDEKIENQNIHDQGEI